MRSVETDPIVPARFVEATFDSFTAGTASQERALTEARRLAEREISSLVIAGPTGVGKTHLAAAVVSTEVAIARSGYADRQEAAEARAVAGEEARWPWPPTYPLWLNVADSLVQMRLEMGYPMDDRDTTMKIHRAAGHAGLVVLDDLGREKTTDWTGETIYALVNARYEALLPTLVTTNLTSAELAASPYWPVVSRLAEDGALVRIEAPDRRLRGAA